MKYMGKKIKLINNYNKHDIQFRMKTRNSKINLIKPKKTKKNHSNFRHSKWDKNQEEHILKIINIYLKLKHTKTPAI